MVNALSPKVNHAGDSCQSDDSNVDQNLEPICRQQSIILKELIEPLIFADGQGDRRLIFLLGLGFQT